MTTASKINSTLFNQAVFVNAFCTKFEDWRYWLMPLLALILPAFGMAVSLSMPHPALTAENQKDYAEFIQEYYTNGMVFSFVAYLFISDGPASGKLIAESDTLSLLFTRPITRFCYVISRYCAALVGASLVMCLSLLLAKVVGLCFGLTAIDISPLMFLSILCNAASWSSLMIFLHSASPLLAGLVYFILYGCSGVGAIYSRAEQSKDIFLEILKSVCLFIDNWFGDLLPTSVNLVSMASTSAFDLYEFSIFISNIGFFLLLAVFALSVREFSYGAE